MNIERVTRFPDEYICKCAIDLKFSTHPIHTCNEIKP